MCGKETSLASTEFPAAAILYQAATAHIFSLYHLLSNTWLIFPLRFAHFMPATFNWKLIVLPKCSCSQAFSPGTHQTSPHNIESKFCYRLKFASRLENMEAKKSMFKASKNPLISQQAIEFCDAGDHQKDPELSALPPSKIRLFSCIPAHHNLREELLFLSVIIPSKNLPPTL